MLDPSTKPKFLHALLNSLNKIVAKKYIVALIFRSKTCKSDVVATVRIEMP